MCSWAPRLLEKTNCPLCCEMLMSTFQEGELVENMEVQEICHIEAEPVSFFHPLIDWMVDDSINDPSKLRTLLVIVVNVGIEARKSDTSFRQSLQNLNDYTYVYHGEVSLMKLTDRFFFRENKEGYWFILFPGCKRFYTYHKNQVLLRQNRGLRRDNKILSKLTVPGCR